MNIYPMCKKRCLLYVTLRLMYVGLLRIGNFWDHAILKVLIMQIIKFKHAMEVQKQRGKHEEKSRA